jgi:DNA repair exonuclease SbcCD ATPase subunit
MKMKKRNLLTATSFLLLATLMLGFGCASKQESTEKIRPGSRIPEYRQVTVGAEKAVEAVLASLTTVGAQSNQCPPEVLTNFSAEVRRLQVESVQVRARTEAMQARGDEYFNHWQQTLARVEDPQMRALVEKERPALQQSFGNIKSLSREGREAYQPFIASLRQVRNALEKDPASLASEPVQASIKTAQEKGGEVRERLLGMQHELDSMSALLTPPRKTNSTGREG